MSAEQIMMQTNITLRLARKRIISNTIFPLVQLNWKNNYDGEYTTINELRKIFVAVVKTD